jgi:hypothetical protein
MYMKDIYYAVAHRDQAEINSFKTRYEDFDGSVIPKVFSDALGLSVLDWKPSDSWGTSHVIYFVRVKEQRQPLVFRANNGFGMPEVVMLTEKLVTDQVLSMRLTTNKILYVDVSRKHYPFDFQVQEDLGGVDPEVNFPDTQKEYDQLSFELGQYIAKLSEFTLPGFGRLDEAAALQGVLMGTKSSMYDYVTAMLEEDLDHLTKAAVLKKRQADRVKQLFVEYREVMNVTQGSVVHHDLADHNLRYEKGHLKAVFDWEAMVVGDPLLDLASCPTWKTLYPREEKLLEGYVSVKRLSKSAKEKMDIYRMRTIIWKTVFCIRAKILTPERVERLGDALQSFNLII